MAVKPLSESNVLRAKILFIVNLVSKVLRVSVSSSEV